ncbi:protein S100-A6-like [Lissotriton helveticus]
MAKVVLEDALLFLIDTFRKYADTDNDKTTLSTKEAVRMIQTELPIFCGKNVSEAECLEIIDIIDTRKNGLIDFSEYITFLTYIARKFHQDLSAAEKKKEGDVCMPSPAPATPTEK